jgi:RNA polymerase sigma-70 factor (ECF subfamily)
VSGNFSEKILLYKLRLRSDPESYTKLYDAYVEQIYRFVYFKVSSKEEAEDITSEVFLKAWHFVQEKQDIKNFKALLYKIARNSVIDLYRRKSVRPESYLEDQLAKGFEPSDAGKWLSQENAQIDSKAIIQALKKLKQEYQEVITLRYVDELEVSEIAEIIGKGNVAVRVTLHRALNKLKEFLKEE